ncbi:MAG: nucleotidyl transferase AbiEii/AbiGii toxin family protein [Christensenellales bacterium]|jgi:predicted nucleotidyltransferase component of viral defense system
MNKDAVMHRVHTIVSQTGLPFNTVLTFYFLEAVLNKLAHTRHAESLVLKGGFLLSNLMGLRNRTTVDMDMLLRNQPLTLENITAIARDICASAAVPEVTCAIHDIEPIRARDAYGGYRIRLLCRQENIRHIVPVDIATGDPVTPHPVAHMYHCLFSGKSIKIAAYNLETILAEKLETIQRLGLLNSRCKDFFDVHTIWQMGREQLHLPTLQEAITRTYLYRAAVWHKEQLLDLLALLSADASMQARWSAWTARNEYAKDLTLTSALESIRALLSVLS